jgi:hypothetical protein
MVGCALTLPVRPGLADVALSIAVLHHLATRERRVEALKCLLRALRPRGGQALVYAWAKEQGEDSRRCFQGAGDGGNVLVPWCLKKHFLSPAAAAAASSGAALGKKAKNDDDMGKDFNSANTTHPSTPTAATSNTSTTVRLPPGAVLDEERGLVVLQRFCHVYVAGELEGLLEEAVRDVGGTFRVASDATLHHHLGEGGICESGGVTKQQQDRASHDEPITARLVEIAREMRMGEEVRGAMECPTDAQVVYTLRASWWEADNWCLLVEKD